MTVEELILIVVIVLLLVTPVGIIIGLAMLIYLLWKRLGGKG